MKLLAFCDDPSLPTGYANVAQHVLAPLAADGWDICICGNGYYGDMPDRTLYPYRYYMPYTVYKGDPCGWMRAAELVTKVRPDAVLWISDHVMIAQFWQAAGKELAGVPSVAYSLVDGDPFPDEYLDGLRRCDEVLVPTQYAQRVITEMDAALGERTLLAPYGHDADVFYPMADDKAEAKALARGKMGGVDPDWFIVLRVDKNQERKNWPATLRVFAEFAKDKPEARLWMHTQFQTEVGHDLAALVHRYGLADKVLNSGLSPARLGVPVSALNAIYNACDVHLSTSGGGGWELSTHEAQACGTPTIAPDYAAMSEVCVGERIPLRGRRVSRHSIDWGEVDEENAGDWLEAMYRHPSQYSEARQRGLSWAAEHTWERTQAPAIVRAAIERAVTAHG